MRKREAIRHLKAAMAEDRLLPQYQPIVGARDPRVVGVEALLRWRDPAREQASVFDLIQSAERSPVIFRLENWTLKQACAAAARWAEAGPPELRVNVNLSAREFPRADLVGRLRHHLTAAGLEGGHIGLEITETSRMVGFDAVATQIERLIAMGIEVWLDDFGTGHSSLEWLSRLPLHGVKIAGTFVERLFTDEGCQTIAAHVIDLAHELGLRVIAEGVETVAQRDFLAGHGCDLLQGFLFHGPLAAPEVARALAGADMLPP